MRRFLLAITVGVLALLPAAAAARTVSASGSGVTATVSYAGRVPSFHDVALTITGSGGTLYRAPVTDRACGDDCWPVTAAASQKVVQVGDFQNDGAADVLLNLYSGGAHCCFIAQVFSPSAAMGGRYVMAARHDFGDPGDTPATLGGKRSFVTADDTFAYAFTDFAASGLPLQILQISDGRFVKVTGQFPGLVRADAARWLVAYHRAGRSNDVGPIAAWAADEATLGRSSQAFTYLDAQARAGRLRSAFGASDSGARFVRRLRALLREDGYPAS